MVKNYLIPGPLSQNLISEIINDLSADTSAGGLSVFLGQVRADTIKGKTVRAIEYSAYEEMVLSEIDRIKSEVMAECEEVKSLFIIHSSGMVMAGEISLLVAASASHRKQAIKACSSAVELVKERLPVWKKEIFGDDTHEWK